MSNETFDIPRHGNAGVVFLGVELAEAWIVIVSVFVGLGVGLKFGAIAFVGIPFGGFVVNKAYVDWRTKTEAGLLRNYLFRIGLVGYSKALRGANVVFEGDSNVINPETHQLVEQVLREKLKRSPRGN